VAGGKVSFAISYSIGQACPMVAGLWGILYFKEFKTAPTISWFLLGNMFLFYTAAIGTLALASAE